MLTVRFDRLGLQAGERLLDLGAGGGRHAFEGLRLGARVVALDRSMADLRPAAAMLLAIIEDVSHPLPARAASGLSVGDALALPFADNTFDRIITSEVLEHIVDDCGAMAEIVRVLRPGGTLAATVPTYLPELANWAISSEYHAPLSVGGMSVSIDASNCSVVFAKLVWWSPVITMLMRCTHRIGGYGARWDWTRPMTIAGCANITTCS